MKKSESEDIPVQKTEVKVEPEVGVKREALEADRPAEETEAKRPKTEEAADTNKYPILFRSHRTWTHILLLPPKSRA